MSLCSLLASSLPLFTSLLLLTLRQTCPWLSLSCGSGVAFCQHQAALGQCLVPRPKYSQPLLNMYYLLNMWQILTHAPSQQPYQVPPVISNLCMMTQDQRGIVTCSKSHSQEVVIIWLADTETHGQGLFHTETQSPSQAELRLPWYPRCAWKRASCPRGTSSETCRSPVRNPRDFLPVS